VACPVPFSDVVTAAVVVVDAAARDAVSVTSAAIVADVFNRLKRDVFPPPTPSAGTEPISPVWDVPSVPMLVVCALLARAAVVLLVICAATVVAEEPSRLKRDVLPPPMPTAGTLPSSVPLPVAVAADADVIAAELDSSVLSTDVSVAGSAAVGAACRGTWKVRLLATYRTGRSFTLLTTLDFLWAG